MQLQPPGFAGTVFLLANRELGARLRSPWLYAVASLICLIAFFYGGGFRRSFETETVLVTTDPLAALNVMVMAVLAGVLGLRLATSIAWEREHRTLEVLLAGPVSPEAILAAKFAGEIVVLAMLTVTHIAYLLLAQPLGPGVIGPADAAAIGRMPLHALPLLALGLLVSTWAKTVRGAVMAYLSILALLIVHEIVLAALTAQSPQDLSLAGAWVRRILTAADTVIDPLSAVARIADLTTGLSVQTPLTPAQTGMALALTAATLAAAALALRARGAS